MGNAKETEDSIRFELDEHVNVALRPEVLPQRQAKDASMKPGR